MRKNCTRPPFAALRTRYKRFPLARSFPFLFVPLLYFFPLFFLFFFHFFSFTMGRLQLRSGGLRALHFGRYRKNREPVFT